MTDAQSAPSTPSPERPALPDVLETLLASRYEPGHTAFLVRIADNIQPDADGCRIDALPEAFGWHPAWRLTDPREALEALTTAGVLPESWAQDERRLFAVDVRCLLCRGRKTMTRMMMPPESFGVADDTREWPVAIKTEEVPCGQCAGTGRVSGPFVCPGTIPDLVAWASLGRDAITRAEALARQVIVDAGARDEMGRLVERVWWRVEPVEYPLPEETYETPAQTDLRAMGVKLWRLSADAITLCVPPIGAP